MQETESGANENSCDRRTGRWRVLGIDYGNKRIGLAISDPGRSLATPLETLDAGSGLMARIREIIKENDVRLVVIGLPWRADGSPGTIHEQIHHFAQNLRKLDLEVVFQDEAFSSDRAKQTLGNSRSGGKSITNEIRNRQQGLIDKRAAAIILQDYLNIHLDIHNNGG
jgi:putative holliday junction resolvase